MQRHRLKDEQWLRIEPLVPGKDGDPGRHGRNNRVAPIQCDWAIYKERHLVECFFGRLKQFRRIATRYDKTAVAFIAFVSLACLMVWLR